jgi:hypothetical protein
MALTTGLKGAAEPLFGKRPGADSSSKRELHHSSVFIGLDVGDKSVTRLVTA